MTLPDLAWITACLTEFLSTSQVNRPAELNGGRIFDPPLVGVAEATDPLFTRLLAPDIVGPPHREPREWLPGAASVVSFFLPFTGAIREANRGAGLPAMEWLYGRIEGEACNKALQKHLAARLVQAGEEALAPSQDPLYSVMNRRSAWSERHVAYIAGLGTFGLSRSFITVKGCAGRLGSIVTSLKLAPTPRNYRDPYEYCLFCGRCRERCPAQAIDAHGIGAEICSRYLDAAIRPRYAPRYGCGKCQTAVPCESGLPNRSG